MDHDAIIRQFSKIDISKITDMELLKLIREHLSTRSLSDAFKMMKIIRAVTKL